MKIIINPMNTDKNYYYSEFDYAFYDLVNFGADIENWKLIEFKTELLNSDFLVVEHLTIFLAYDGEK